MSFTLNKKWYIFYFTNCYSSLSNIRVVCKYVILIGIHLIMYAVHKLMNIALCFRKVGGKEEREYQVCIFFLIIRRIDTMP